MNAYFVYDEIVRSDTLLHYPQAPQHTPYIWTLCQAEDVIAVDHATCVHTQEDFPGGPLLQIYEAEHGTHHLIDYAGWRFACHDDRVEYTGSPSSDIELPEIIERVIAPWMILRRRESVIALHGGAVSVQDRAVVFMGESGAGKSSAALSLVRRGAALLSDDMALVDVETLDVLPGAWTLRMWHAHDQEDLQSQGVVVGTSGQKQRYIYARTRVIEKGVGLSLVCELVRDESRSVRGEFEHVSGVRALGVLLGQCFDLSHAPVSWSTRRLALARSLLGKLGGIKRLRYATSPDGLPVHADALWEVIGDR